jgi:hypothetical protein
MRSAWRSPSESIDGVALLDAARDHQFRLLMKLGRKARAEKAWDGRRPASRRRPRSRGRTAIGSPPA